MSLSYLFKSLEIKQAKNNRSLTLANTLNNIGVVYSLIDQDDKAIDYFNRSLLIQNEKKPKNYFNRHVIKRNIDIIKKKQNTWFLTKLINRIFFYFDHYDHEKFLEYIWITSRVFD